jgi:NTE family protein
VKLGPDGALWIADFYTPIIGHYEQPLADLGKLAGKFEADLPRSFRFLTRGLGTKETRTSDFLSLILFDQDYLQALIEMGERDAEVRADEIEAFLAVDD